MCAVLPRWLSGGALRWGASVAVPAEAQSGALQSPRLELLVHATHGQANSACSERSKHCMLKGMRSGKHGF